MTSQLSGASRSFGNRVVAIVVQAKVRAGPSNDAHETEADRVAAQVMRTAGPGLQRAQGRAGAGMTFAPPATDGVGSLQRSRRGPRGAAPVPPLVHETLRRPGEPLGDATRRVMEPRLGYDLGQVRVHADALAAHSAAAVNARAYTVGRHIVFGSGEFRPGSFEGMRLLAHELAHTIQQGGVHDPLRSGGGVGATAPPAPRVQTTPTGQRLQRIRLTNGQFGKALERYQQEVSIPDRPFRLIWRSGVYQGMVRELDRHYVNLYEPTLPHYYVLGNDGRLESHPDNGRWAGRRVIYIWTSGVTEAKEFRPAQRASDGYDEMWLHDRFYWNPHVPPQDPIAQDGTFLEGLAHETAHAHNLVTGTGRPATGPNPTLAQSISASVQEEIHTRQQEERVLAQVQGRGGLRGYAPSAGGTVPRDVERSLVSGELRQTYLEMFYFTRRIEDARAQLTDAEASRTERIVRGIPLSEHTADRYLDRRSWIMYHDPGVNLYRILDSEYGQWLFWQRVVNERWRAFERQAGTTPDDRERLIQEHAAAYFENGVAYTP